MFHSAVEEKIIASAERTPGGASHSLCRGNDLEEPMQAGSLRFIQECFSIDKAREKQEYMHNNPVKKGLAAKAPEWRCGSAKWRLLKRSVGIELVALS